MPWPWDTQPQPPPTRPGFDPFSAGDKAIAVGTLHTLGGRVYQWDGKRWYDTGVADPSSRQDQTPNIGLNPATGRYEYFTVGPGGAPQFGGVEAPPVNAHPGTSYSYSSSVSDIGPNSLANDEANRAAQAQQAAANRAQQQRALDETIRANQQQEANDRIRLAVLQRQADIQQEDNRLKDAQATRALAEQIQTRIFSAVQQRQTLLHQAAVQNQQADIEAARINEQARQANLSAQRQNAVDIGEFTSRPGDIGKAAGYLASYGRDSASPISTAIASGANAITPERMAILDALSGQHDTLAQGPRVFTPQHITPDTSLYDEAIRNAQAGLSGFGIANRTPPVQMREDPAHPNTFIPVESTDGGGGRGALTVASGPNAGSLADTPVGRGVANSALEAAGVPSWVPRFSMGTKERYATGTFVAGDSTDPQDPAAGGAHPEMIELEDPPGPNNARAKVQPIVPPGVGDTSGNEAASVGGLFAAISKFLMEHGGDEEGRPMTGGMGGMMDVPRHAFGTDPGANPLFGGDTSSGIGIMQRAVALAKQLGGFGTEIPTPVSVATPGYSPFRQRLAASVASTASGIDPELFAEEVEKSTPKGRADYVVKRTA